jgi:hypothetical protein
LQRALVQYRVFYDGHRPHQGIDNQIPEDVANEGVIAFPAQTGNKKFSIGCESFLGGLLNSYDRKAA